MILRVKSQAMTVSVRVPWRFGSALKDGRSTMVRSGTKVAMSSAGGRISRLRMNRECQAYSVKTRALTRKAGSVVPYGVYDVGANAGWVSVGITSDTAEFAVASIRQWLNRMGRKRYPDARELTITADCGGSNGARVRLWKIELQRFADETGLVLNVHHYPPGTSKWNRNRAPPVLPHHADLARPAAHGSHGCRRADRSDDNQGRPENRERAGHARLRKGHQGQRCPDEGARHSR